MWLITQIFKDVTCCYTGDLMDVIAAPFDLQCMSSAHGSELWRTLPRGDPTLWDWAGLSVHPHHEGPKLKQSWVINVIYAMYNPVKKNLKYTTATLWVEYKKTTKNKDDQKWRQ